MLEYYYSQQNYGTVDYEPYVIERFLDTLNILFTNFYANLFGAGARKIYKWSATFIVLGLWTFAIDVDKKQLFSSEIIQEVSASQTHVYFKGTTTPIFEDEIEELMLKNDYTIVQGLGEGNLYIEFGGTKFFRRSSCTLLKSFHDYPILAMTYPNLFNEISSNCAANNNGGLPIGGLS